MVKEEAVKRGRPSIISQDKIELIVSALHAGAFVETAVQYAGIHKDTYYEWKKKGEREAYNAYTEDRKVVTELQVYVDFADAINKAEAEAEMSLLGIVRKAAKDDPHYAQWLLDRRFKWGVAAQMVATQISGGGGRLTIIIEDAVPPVKQLKLVDPDEFNVIGDES